MWLRRLHQMCSGKGMFVGLIIGFIAVESIVAACFLSLLHFKASNQWAWQSQHVLIELERMVGTLAGAETSQRGYVITGSDGYLIPYRDALDTLDAHVRRIGNLTRHNHVQQNRVAYLETQIDQRSDEMNQVIVTRRTKGLPFAKSDVVVNQQNRTMDSIRDVIGQIRDEETEVLEQHRQDSRAWALTTGSFAVAFFFLTALLFALCGVVMKVALSSQTQAERLILALPRPAAVSAAR